MVTLRPANSGNPFRLPYPVLLILILFPDSVLFYLHLSLSFSFRPLSRYSLPGIGPVTAFLPLNIRRLRRTGDLSYASLQRKSLVYDEYME